MMSFEEFTENILQEICDRADGVFQIRRQDVTKNNNVKLTGISVMKEEADIGPCIYLNEFFGEYESGGMNFDEIVDEVYRQILKHKDDEVPDFDTEGFLNWETVKGTIYAKLVNAEQNKEQLEKIPHRSFMDLAVVYYAVARDHAQEEFGVIPIHNGHMEKWGQDEEALYQTAMGNMRAAGEPYFVSMETVIKSFLPDTVVPGEREHKPEKDMYILTNGRKKYGASEILDKSTLRMIADQVGDGFVVLPSSLHETIVLPSKDEAEYEWLAGMVREVNDTHVDIEERLSYHVYVYSRDEDALQIVA